MSELGPELKFKAVDAICPLCGEHHKIKPKDGLGHMYAYTGRVPARINHPSCEKALRKKQRAGTGANFTRGQEYDY